ncbi:MAG: ABC transporter permease [Bryobacteraceae bacterium]
MGPFEQIANFVRAIQELAWLRTAKLVSIGKTYRIALLPSNLMQDVRYAIRMARRNAGSTLAAFITLALGIGATTAIFTVVDSVMLRPLPLKDPGRIVRIFETKWSAREADISMADYLDWKTNLKSFDSLAIYRESQANLVGGSNPERVRIFICESTLLSLLGTGLIRGRNFFPQENNPGHDAVAILSSSFWRRHYGGQTSLGKKILLDNKPYTVVGVLRDGSFVLGDRDIFVPVTFDLRQLQNARGYHQYSALGRLRNGVSLAQANTELAAVAKSLAAEYPKQNAGVGALAISLQGSITGEIRPVLIMLFGAVMCVLLIACGNVANLLLARASARQREVSVRMAIGASRSRVCRQLLTESVLLSCSAALAGVGLAIIAVRVVRSLENTRIPRPGSITVDWRVLLFAIGTGLVTSIVFGLAPALGLSMTQVNDTLKQLGGRVTESRGHRRLRQLFICLETTFAVLLLIESGLLIKSFVRAYSTNPGFQTKHVITLQISLPETRYGRPGTVGAFVNNALERIRSIPGLQAAAIGTNLPFLGSGLCPIVIEGRPADKSLDSQFVQFNEISPGYFRTLQISMLSGRDFSFRDTMNSVPVVIVNEAFADRFFGAKNTLSHHLAYSADHPHWKEIIGVVQNVRQHGIENRAVPEMFTPLAQDEFKWLSIVARTNGDPLRFTKAIEAQVHQVDPELAVFLPRTMEQIISRELGWRAFHTFLLIVFACIAITLASLGIYAVLAYSVTQRVNEIGVRIALGAERSDILRMIVRQGIAPALFGAMAGAICSLGMSRLLSQLLYDVQPLDPFTYFSAIALLLMVALAAAYFPARRAASLDPSQALRYE